MKPIDLHPTPTLWAVLLEQARIVGRTLRPLGIGLGALVAFFTIWTLVDRPVRPVAFHLGDDISWLISLLGIVFPLFLLHGALNPFRAGFPWTLPVERSRHALARVMAGWMWLMVCVAGFLLWRMGLSALTGGGPLDPQTWLLAPIPGTETGPLDPSSLPTVVWTWPWWHWLVPFSCATGLYLATSTFLLSTRYPIRWVAGTIFTVLFVIVVAERADLRWLADVAEVILTPIMAGRYGLATYLTGSNVTFTIVHLPTGEMMKVWLGLPTFERLVVSTLLWTTACLAMLWIAALRHRDGRGSRSSE